ncbi:MAG: methyltransferase domain-containing protein [Rhodocyclaceae bacterium]|nr:methyltransferase domain-containing protein [Rhodocyclaceae bacterium]
MTRSSFDPLRFKALERSGFNRIAQRYAAGAAMRSALADALLDAAALAPGQRVLDLASGPCLLAHDAARQVLPQGWVLASDIAENMLIEGRRRFDPSDPAAGALRYAAADAEHLCLPDASFDRVLAGLALFMFPHPNRALSEIRRVLRPGGRFALSVWGPREEVPLLHRAQDCIARVLPPTRIERPSVYRFGNPAELESALTAAGLTDVRIEPCRFNCRFDSVDHYWRAFLDLAGGAAESLSRLPDDLQARLRDEVALELESHRIGQTVWEVGALALVATANA